MKALVAWVKRQGEKSTPRLIGVLIILVVVADVAVGLALGKQLSSPFSMTPREYVTSMIEQASTWTGYLFWSFFITIGIAGPLLTGKKPRALDFTAFAESVLKRVADALVKLRVSASLLATASLLLIGLSLGLAWASRPPAPPRPGQFVIPTDPRARTFYRVIQNAVAIYNQYGTGSAQFPVQALQLSDASRIENIALSFDQSRIYATDSENGLLHVIDGRCRLREEAHVHVGKTVKSVVLSSDGRKLYVGVVGPIPLGRIRVLDSIKLKEINSIGGLGCPFDLFAAADAPLLFVATQCGGGNDPLYVIDTRKDEVIKKVPGFAVGNSVLATPDGKTVLVSTGDSLNIVQDYMAEKPNIKRLAITVTAMALAPDSRTLFVGTKVGEQPAIVSLDVGTGKPCRSVGLEATPLSIVIAPDGSLLAPLPERLFVSDYRALACSQQ